MSYVPPYGTRRSGIATFDVRRYGMDPTNSASGNAAALQRAISDAQKPPTPHGGAILVPPVGQYKIKGPITIGTAQAPNPLPLFIVGTEAGTEFAPILFNVNDDGSANNSALFSVYTVYMPESDMDDVGGVTFENLHIQCASQLAAKSPAAVGAAIHILNGRNTRIVRCVFFDCPQPIAFGDTAQCDMYECRAQYSSGGKVMPASA